MDLRAHQGEEEAPFATEIAVFQPVAVAGLGARAAAGLGLQGGRDELGLLPPIALL